MAAASKCHFSCLVCLSCFVCLVLVRVVAGCPIRYSHAARVARPLVLCFLLRASLVSTCSNVSTPRTVPKERARLVWSLRGVLVLWRSSYLQHLM